MKPHPSAQSATDAHLSPWSGFRLGRAAWTVFQALIAAGLLAWVPPAMAANPRAPAPSEAGDPQGRSAALLRANAAVVGLQVMALDDARSAATLGRARSGFCSNETGGPSWGPLHPVESPAVPSRSPGSGRRPVVPGLPAHPGVGS